MKKLIASLPHCLIATLLVVAACTSRPAEPITLAIEADPDSKATSIRVKGLSSDELSSLTRASLTEEQWQALLRVTVANAPAGAPPVAGRFTVTPSAVEFTPRFPFEPGRHYAASFDPARLPSPRSGPPVNLELSLPAAAAGLPTMLARMLPSADVLPENLLRVYFEFSAPMSRESGTGFLRLLDETGREVQDAFLDVDVDFWSPDYRRFTQFFAPGRVKRDIEPNKQLGRALRAGKRYTIEADPRWRDANGQSLAVPFRRSFTAGPAELQPLRIEDWTLTPPAAGSRAALMVRFPKPLDHGLLQRAVGVARAGQRDPLPGDVAIGRDEREWTFTPRDPWKAGAYDLVALAILEDPAGNRIGRAFDRDKLGAPDTSGTTDRHTRPFVIK